MSEIDDTEFLEAIVNNQKLFMTTQLETFKKELLERIQTVERQCASLERELIGKDLMIKRLVTEIPRHVDSHMKSTLQKAINHLDRVDHVDTEDTSDVLDDTVAGPVTSTPSQPPQSTLEPLEPPVKKRKESIE